MTRVVPPTGEPALPMKRRPLTPGQRRYLIELQGGRCGCGCLGALDSGPVIDEHIQPLDLLGSNHISNRSLWLAACSARKTAEVDLPKIAKVRRQRKKALKPRKHSKRPIKSRGFDRKRRRHMDGSVSERTT